MHLDSSDPGEQVPIACIPKPLRADAAIMQLDRQDASEVVGIVRHWRRMRFACFWDNSRRVGIEQGRVHHMQGQFEQWVVPSGLYACVVPRAIPTVSL